MAYRLEYARSGRSSCKGPKVCNKAKIDKDTLRLGTVVEIQSNTTFAWRHWGCVTSQQLKNIKKALGDDAEDIDGFEDLNEQDQQRVQEALKREAIAEEDLTPAVKEARDAADVETSPKKATPKKRAKKAKKEDDSDIEADEPDFDGSPPPKAAAKKRGRAKKHVKDEKLLNDDADDEPADAISEEEVMPQKKQRGLPKKAAKDDGSETTIMVKKQRGSTQKQQVKNEDVDMAEPAPPKKRGRKPVSSDGADGTSSLPSSSVKVEEIPYPVPMESTPPKGRGHPKNAVKSEDNKNAPATSTVDSSAGTSNGTKKRPLPAQTKATKKTAASSSAVPNAKRENGTEAAKGKRGRSSKVKEEEAKQGPIEVPTDSAVAKKGRGRPKKGPA